MVYYDEMIELRPNSLPIFYPQIFWITPQTFSTPPPQK